MPKTFKSATNAFYSSSTGTGAALTGTTPTIMSAVQLPILRAGDFIELEAVGTITGDGHADLALFNLLSLSPTDLNGADMGGSTYIAPAPTTFGQFWLRKVTQITAMGPSSGSGGGIGICCYVSTNPVFPAEPFRGDAYGFAGSPNANNTQRCYWKIMGAWNTAGTGLSAQVTLVNVRVNQSARALLV